MPTPGQVDVTESLIAFLRERQTRGIATYGRSLQTFNGRNAVQDLREELVDAAQYATQWLLEREQLTAENERLRTRIAELDYLRPPVRAFARAMEEQLRANDHKGGWDDCSLQYLRDRMDVELWELKRALRRSPVNLLEVMEETADVANFLMMVVDNSGALKQAESAQTGNVAQSEAGDAPR